MKSLLSNVLILALKDNRLNFSNEFQPIHVSPPSILLVHFLFLNHTGHTQQLGLPVNLHKQVPRQRKLLARQLHQTLAVEKLLIKLDQFLLVFLLVQLNALLALHYLVQPLVVVVLFGDVALELLPDLAHRLEWELDAAV